MKRITVPMGRNGDVKVAQDEADSSDLFPWTERMLT
jgi:hypothetical protein